MNMGFAVFVLALFISMFLSATIRYVREDYRIVVFRLGRLRGVFGPGTVFLIPFIDKSIKVNYSELPYSWEYLPKKELEERIKKNLNLV